MDHELYEDAMRLLEADRAEEADALVGERLDGAEKEHGRGDPRWGLVAFEAAQFFVAREKVAEARALLEGASKVAWEGEEGVGHRLTVQLNLGELCLYQGDLPAAERYLRTTVEGRAEHFGVDHPAHAFGLEAYADLLLAQREVAQAKETIEEAERILRANPHPRLAGVLVLRAHIEKAAGGLRAKGFGDLNDFDEGLLDDVVMETIVRGQASHPDLSFSVLNELRRHLQRERGADDPAVGHVAAAMVRAAANAEDGEARVEALRHLVRHFRATEDLEQAGDALQALAIAQNEIGQHEPAEESYRAAVDVAREGGDPSHARVLRGFGLFLSSMGRKVDAEPVLAEAVEVARGAGDKVELGRGLVALGILKHQHGGGEVARPLLEEGLALLPSDHGDCLFAQRHLAAIAAGEVLDDKEADAVSETLLAMLRDRVPEDLLNDVRVGVDDGGQLDLQLDLAREPTDDEAAVLEEQVERALAALSEKLHKRLDS